MKLLITGGHLTPALGLIDYVQQQQPADVIVFVGREYSQEKNKQPSKERTEIEERGLTFIPFTSGKFVEKNPVALVASTALCIKAFFHACAILLKEKPDIFISFGSYLAVPVAVAAWLLRVPIITHEQTRTIGTANRFITHLAKVTAVSYPQTAALLPNKKVVVTGNVMRQQLVQKSPKQPAWITFKPEKPLLYITGGSQGSEVINTVVCQSLPRILKDWYVIHQCGAANMNRSYKQELETAREQLKPQLRFSYIVREWVSVEELAWIYKNATGLISRAGANTTQEVALFKIPSIMIPLPFSNHNEQLLNAQWLEETGGAIIIHQKDLLTEVLCDALDILQNRHKAFRRKLEELEVPLDADKQLYELAQTHARS